MRKLFAIALVTLLLGAGIVGIIQTDPGYVLVAHGNYTLEASLWVGLLLLLLLVLSIFLLLRLVYQIFSGQRSLVSWWGARKSRKASRLSTRGTISFIEGNWDIARRQLVSGAAHNESPLLNYVLAARASAQLQDGEKIQEYLRAAKEAEPGAAMAMEIALADIHVQAAEYQQAIAALDQAMRNPGRHPHALRVLQQAYEGLQDWEKVVDLLPQLQKHKVLSSGDLQQLERLAHLRRLQQSDTTAEQLNASWQKVPRPLQNDSALIEAYVRNLIVRADHGTAEKIILQALKQEWQPALVRLFAFVEADPARQLARAEGWLAEHPLEPQLLLCLGRLSARDKLWGKARDYFESAYRLQRSAEICAELGRLLDALGEPTVAAAYFREGLLLQEDKLPALPRPDPFTPTARIAAGT
jgi:HemY protein